MRKFYSKWFAKWLKKTKLSNLKLIQAIKDLEENKGSAHLGAFLYKVRVASANKGKSGGYRTIIVYKEGIRVIFLSAFAKNEMENITKSQLVNYLELANTLSIFSDEQFDVLVSNGEMIEIPEAKKQDPKKRNN